MAVLSGNQLYIYNTYYNTLYITRFSDFTFRVYFMYVYVLKPFPRYLTFQVKISAFHLKILTFSVFYQFFEQFLERFALICTHSLNSP